MNPALLTPSADHTREAVVRSKSRRQPPRYPAAQQGAPPLLIITAAVHASCDSKSIMAQTCTELRVLKKLWLAIAAEKMAVHEAPGSVTVQGAAEVHAHEHVNMT